MPRATPARAAGNARGCTTRRRRSGPAPTRSSATSSASGCWGSRATRTRPGTGMAYETILYDVDGHVATITMNRPDAANAQSTTLIDELDAAFDVADADDDVRVVILAGAGKHFSAGH